MPKHVFLVDGSGFIFRAYHALPPMTRDDGTPVNAVYGFTNMLWKLLEDTDADHVAVVFDEARKTFRSEIYDQYKAHRPPPPEDLIPQFALVREATEALNIPAVSMEGYEADDLIATYARRAEADGAEVTIVSSDKDLMQLVGPRVTMMDAMRNKIIGPNEVMEKFGVGPERVVDVQALAGDSSDNVPGVEGIGVKTAAQLVNEYGDLDGVLAAAPGIKQRKRRERLMEQADRARISRDLVALKEDAPIDRPLSDFRVKEPNPGILLPFLKKQQFKSLIAKAETRFAAAGRASSEAGKARQPETDYALVAAMADLRAWVEEATKAGLVAVDTETTGLNPMRAALVGVSLCVSPGRACYIPLRHKPPPQQASHKAPLEQGALDFEGGGDSAEGGDIRQLSPAAALPVLKSLLEDPGVLKIGHNVKYDMRVFAREGIEVAPIDDTMLISNVLAGGLRGHGLDELAERHLGIATIKFKDVAGTGKSMVSFDRVALEAAKTYAAEDADITRGLHAILKPDLLKERLLTVYETLERPLVAVLRDMEEAGVKVDARRLKALSADFEKRLEDLEGQIHKLAGRAFNIASPKQLGGVLFDEMGIPGGKKGRTGAYATGADILENLAAEGHQLPARVLDYRQLAKLKSTYTDALLKDIDPTTGRIHTSFAQAATSTGRLSSSNPNLQNIPIRTEEGRKIREAFIAEPGHVLISADYSQIELRLLAHVAKLESLRRAFADGLDIHAMTASRVFGVPIEGMDPMVRRRAKAINFGIVYGISAFGLARQLNIGRGEAAEYIEAYFKQYPGIRAYMEETKGLAREQGYVTTLFGRRCHVRGINDKNPNVRNFSERAAINAPIQGGAADIIKRAMTRLPGALVEADLKTTMLLQVHDELIFEAPETEVERAKALIVDIMENAAELSVPRVVEAGVGRDWSSAH